MNAPSRMSHRQMRQFMAICEDIAASGQPFAGRARDRYDWKVVLISAHAVATGRREAEVHEGLEGELIDVRESLTRMDAATGSSLIEFACAWCAERGIALRDPLPKTSCMDEPKLVQ